MKYLVMERRTGYAVLLDEAGCFWKAADLHYTVGQTVRDPVLMRDAPRGGLRVARRAGAVLALAACLLLFAGFGYYQMYLRAYSFVYLTINPQVQMDLNRRGTVVRLTGTNEDGQALVEGYDGRGKDKVTVADELIDRAIEMGFLSEGGQVSISIDAPDEALFQEYGAQLRTQISAHLEGGMTVTIRITDFNQDAGLSAEQAPPVSSASPAPVTPQATPAPPPAGGSDYGVSDYGASAPAQQGGDSGYQPPAGDSGFDPPAGDSGFDPPAGGSDFGGAEDADDADDDDDDDDDDD